MNGGKGGGDLPPPVLDRVNKGYLNCVANYLSCCPEILG